MATSGILPFSAESFSLLDNFNTSEIEALKSIAETQRFRKGEIIVREGDLSEEIYFVGDGSIDIVAEESQVLLRTMGKGYSFGELAFLDGSPRSATVRARDDVQLYVLKKEGLTNHPGGSNFLFKFYQSVAIDSSHKLKTTTSDYVHSLEKEMEMLKEKGRFQQFLISTLVGSSLVLVVSDYTQSQLPQGTAYTDLFAWAYLILIIGPTFYFAIKSEIPWREFGLNLDNWKKALLEGLGIAAACVTLILGAFFWASANQLYGLPSDPHFSIRAFFRLEPVLYLLHSFGQEFLSRGVFLGALFRFLGSKKQAILLSSLIFALSHVPYGLTLVVPTFVGGILFALLYLRSRNLIAVTIVHWSLGAVLFIILQMMGQTTG